MPPQVIPGGIISKYGLFNVMECLLHNYFNIKTVLLSWMVFIMIIYCPKHSLSLLANVCLIYRDKHLPLVLMLNWLAFLNLTISIISAHDNLHI
jgi:hypothetical protein